MSGVAHITGGGQPSKLGRMLEPSELGVTINTPIEPPRIMTEVQKLRGFSDETAYGKWHWGGLVWLLLLLSQKKCLQKHKALDYLHRPSGKLLTSQESVLRIVEPFKTRNGSPFNYAQTFTPKNRKDASGSIQSRMRLLQLEL